MSVTSPYVPNEGKFPDQIDSGEVADQGWTDTGMPRKRWLPGMDISFERRTSVPLSQLCQIGQNRLRAQVKLMIGEQSRTWFSGLLCCAVFFQDPMLHLLLLFQPMFWSALKALGL